jgi:excisionase family DNA binding protein
MAESRCPTLQELRERPTITIREYAAFIGVSKDTAYEAAARGELRVLRLGRRMLVPTQPLLDELGYSTPDGLQSHDDARE